MEILGIKPFHHQIVVEEASHFFLWCSNRQDPVYTTIMWFLRLNYDDGYRTEKNGDIGDNGRVLVDNEQTARVAEKELQRLR